LQLRWAYNTEVHRKETIERVAQWQIEALRDVIRESRKAKVTQGYSPSDFPMAELNNQTLAEILSNIGSDT
jgi:microcystin synthetase protein McyA